MDTFDTTITGLVKISSAERTATINDLKKKCPCPVCPTYNDCAKRSKEVLFCLFGRSFNCVTVDKGCICQTTCPLAPQVGLTFKDFCLKGSEAAQRYFKRMA